MADEKTTKETLGDEARATADKAKSSAHNMADEARAKAAEMAEEARDRAWQQGEYYKNAAADETGKVASALRKASDDLRDGTPQERVIGRMAEGLAETADGMREMDVTEIGRELTGFARRNPVAFLGGAALLGFAASRFLKASAHHDDGYTAGPPMRRPSDPYPPRPVGDVDPVGTTPPRPAPTPGGTV
ncbi:hypothetical protein [Tranquillimonas alkanivorans]|uniref:Late embryogenesis abundant protein n=1 Tax=Tranquillimonas alkanivorans TaxID=441119 RepID=A0A1I5PJ22_9RHOB|nr:hypothetical protein [Tranquillimonas alkanivorans]SFP34029.1 hypothetical protein SAMN04488047_105128 [Tranquillimonas alkanivorans]